jgi:hypothetical protein
MFREAEVLHSQGFKMTDVYLKLRNELLNGEIFDTLLEASVLIERWWREHNQYRPRSSLDNRPPAPEAF